MTIQMKESIQAMRLEGMKYSEISKITGIPMNTVKSYCRRQGLAEAKVQELLESRKNLCKHCGKHLSYTPKCKPKKFCDDRCRHAWWNTHRDLLRKNAVYEFTCPRCGVAFTSYGNKSRKYCSHDCYIIDRFGSLYGQTNEAPRRREG